MESLKRYNVYTKDGDLCGENLSLQEVVKLIGIDKKTVSSYAKYGYLCRNKYRIEDVAGNQESEPSKRELSVYQKFGAENVRAWREMNRRYGRRHEV